MTGQEFIDGATVEPRGNAWGAPLWSFSNADTDFSVDAQGATLDEAKAKAVVTADEILSRIAA